MGEQELKQRIAELESRLAELEAGESERQRVQDAMRERDEALQLYSALLVQEQAVQQRLSLLAEASEVLGTSLAYETVLLKLARLILPQLGDWCVIDLVEDRVIRRLAVVHIDDNRVEPAQQLKDAINRQSESTIVLPRIFEGGQAEIYHDIPETLVTDRDDTETLKIIFELGFRNALVVPLRSQRRILGVITLVNTRINHEYTREDMLLAEDLARRTALAIDNARLFQEVKEASRLKDEFLATVSHELRTPLTAMLGWTRLLRSGRLEPDASLHALETIERNAKSQAQLIEDLLDISRIITGKLRLEMRPLDPIPIIEAAIDSLRPAATAKRIDLQIKMEKDDRALLGDASRLQQIVWNLLSNAIKFTPNDGHVEVGLNYSSNFVEVVVRDTGRGISADFLPYVFNRFSQADGSLTRAHGGLGLGLAIVRHLVELQGGTVEVHSKGDNLGATFVVKFPLNTARPENRPAFDEDEIDEPLLKTVSLEGIHILVVDDEVDTRDLLVVMLAQFGAEVRTCASAAEVLNVMADIKQWRPDILVSDIGMPDEDGYSLIRKVRQRGADQGGQIPAIALTAFARAEDRARAISAGFHMHVPKPVEPVELATVIASLLGRLDATSSTGALSPKKLSHKSSGALKSRSGKYSRARMLDSMSD